jgi:hypothetical protein
MMHILPFGTTLSDALVEAIRKMAEHCRRDHPDFVPHVGRGTSDRGEHWELMAGPRSYMGAENIFTVGDVSVHITALDQTKCAGKVLDWKDGVGVFEGGTPII